MDRFWPTLGLWTVVCCVSAAPSFVISAMMDPQPARIVAMLAGIGVFIAAYTGVSLCEVGRQARRWRNVRYALITGYVTRMAITVLFPIGGAVDMVCGVVTGAALGPLVDASFADGPLWVGVVTFVWTLAQGTVLNVLLAVYMLLVYGVLRLGGADVDRDALVGRICLTCGYDLRASSGMCPECGEPIPVPVRRSPEPVSIHEAG